MVNVNFETEELKETASLAPGRIEIPTSLRNHSVSLLPVSSRLSGVFKRANIRVLGDLHGRSQYDFSLHRNCGHKTMKELEALVRVVAQCNERNLFDPSAISFQSPVFSVSTSRAHLRFVDLPISRRLDRAVHKIGINRLGDLNGRSAVQLQECPGVGPSRVAEMQQLVMRANAGEFKDLLLHVPTAAADLRFVDLPISSRAARLIKMLQIKRLGDLNGLSPVQFQAFAGIGQRTVAEIRQLIARAAAGDFAAPFEIDESEHVPELLRLIEAGLARLPLADRQLFLAKLGHDDGQPLSLSQLANRHGVTREAIRQTIEKVVVTLRKTWGPRIPLLLSAIKNRCLTEVCPFTPDLLSAWLADRGAALGLSLGVHVRIIAMLDKGIPTWPDEIEGAHSSKKKNRDFANLVMQILRAADDSLSLAEIFSQLSSRPKYVHWSIQTFLRMVRRINGAIGIDRTVPEKPLARLIAN